MSGVAFLLIAVGLSLIGTLIVWFRTRQPTHWDSGISEFSKNMEALSQTRPIDQDPSGRRPRRSRRR
jgi:hypothetical protein